MPRERQRLAKYLRPIGWRDHQHTFLQHQFKQHTMNKNERPKRVNILHHKFEKIIRKISCDLRIWLALHPARHLHVLHDCQVTLGRGSLDIAARSLYAADQHGLHHRDQSLHLLIRNVQVSGVDVHAIREVSHTKTRKVTCSDVSSCHVGNTPNGLNLLALVDLNAGTKVIELDQHLNVVVARVGMACIYM